jgi:hypothetical protein
MLGAHDNMRVLNDMSAMKVHFGQHVPNRGYQHRQRPVVSEPLAYVAGDHSIDHRPLAELHKMTAMSQ